MSEERAKLRQHLEAIENQIHALRVEAIEIRSRLAEIKYGVKVGEVVEYNGAKYKIARFDSYWPVGRKIIKDGSVSVKDSNLYDFPKVQSEAWERAK